jgi:cell wall-associated NlpC family hydrolase
MHEPGGRRRSMVTLVARLALAAATAGLGSLAGCSSTPRAARSDPAALPPAVAADVVLSAMALLDTRYRRGGGDAESGFDCSGFTRHVFERSLGLLLPRTAWDQARFPELREVGGNALLPGDLVFFNTLQRSHSHVGIYVGEGRFIHAPRPGLAVRLEEMQARYWAQRFDGARRAPAGGRPVGPPDPA